MLSDNDQRALDLLNDGGSCYQTSPSDAIDRWEEALTLKPTPGLEALIRGRLVRVFLDPFVNLKEGTVLSEQQGHGFLQGEKHLIRLHNLIEEESPQHRLEGLEAEDLDFSRKVVQAYSLVIFRCGQGWYILPGDESIIRLIDYGYAVADKGDKPAAIPPLEKALTLIDETKLRHKEYALKARVRLTGLLSAVGRRLEARQHASWVLDSGMADDDLRIRTMMETLI